MPPQTSRYQPGYDCPLPEGVLDELLGKRLPPRATERQPAVWKRVLHLLAWLSVPIALVALLCAILTALHDKPATRPSMLVQAPSVQPAPAVEHVVEQPLLAPRAQLLKLPPPRATLVALPEWHVGETRRLLMPYGLEVVGRLRGHSEDELYLPTSGNTIGDTWLVENTPWVWITVPGTTAPTWVDP